MTDRTPWTRWDRFDWNICLIRHYFGRTAEGDNGPVRRIDVSWTGLVALTGDLQTTALEVREALIAKVRPSLESGTSSGLSPTLRHQGVPDYFLHLFLTCLVASDALEDKENEGEVEQDFREALETLLGDRLCASRLIDILPQLWNGFADWSTDSQDFRSLELPQVGNETIIGYSKRLVFPRVRDQRQLVGLLERADLRMEDPPLYAVARRLASSRGQMSNTLREAFDDFTEALADTSDQQSIADHRFVAAINSAIRNPLLIGDDSLSYSTTILVYDYLDDFELVVAAAGPTPFPGAITEQDDFLPSDWQNRVVTINDIADPLLAILSKHDQMPLRWLVTPGVIPFINDDSGVYEILAKGRLAECSLLMIRRDIGPAICTAFSIDENSMVPSGIPEWSFLRSPRLRQLTSEEISAAGLSDVTVLYERPMRNVLRLRDGYEVVGDFLGFRSITPWIYAPEALDVEATLDGVPLLLRREDTGWYLPDTNLFGPLHITANYAGGKSLQKMTRLIAEPTNDTYRGPSTPAKWMQETLAGVSLYPDARYLNVSETENAISDALQRIYLGPTIGEFLPGQYGAVWELTSFGSIRTVRCHDPVAAKSGPTERLHDGGLCRAWRKAIELYLPAASNHEIKSNMSRAKQAKKLEVTEARSPTQAYAVRPDSFGDSDPHCALVQAVLGSYCSRRRGMQVKDWHGLLESKFGIGAMERRLVHRAWLEAGFIDELVQVRWPSAAVFPTSPFLWRFSASGAHFGTVAGLVMPGRLNALEHLALALELSISMNNAPSPYVPRRLMLRSDNPSLIEEFAKRANLEIRHLSAVPTLTLHPREVGHQPPLGYQSERAFPTFAIPDGAEITMCSRRNGPRYWRGRTPDDKIVWSFSPEATLYRLQRASGVQTAILGLGNEIAAQGAFLPLTVARWLSSVGGISPGPYNGTYMNVAPSRQLAERVMSYIEAGDPSLGDNRA